MDGAGIADDNGMGGNVTIDKGSRSNQDIVSDGDLSDHGSIDTDAHATADSRNALAGTAAFYADGHALMEVAIVAQDGGAIHGDVVGMAHIKALPNSGATRNLNPMPSRMKPEQGFVKHSRERVLPSLGFPKKEMPHPQIP